MNIVNKLLVLTLAVLFIGLGIGMAYATPSVSIDPASSSVAGAGESFSVDVLVDPAGETLAGGTVELSFDSDVLSITSHSDGTIFSCDSSGMGSDWATAGYAKINLAALGCTATTEGTWASITFEVAAGTSDGVYDIGITSAVLKDQTTAVLPGTTTTNGTVTVATADTTDPIIGSVSLNPTSVGPGDLVTVTVVATDASGIASVTADGTTGTVTLADQGDDTWEGTITAPSTAGTYPVTVVATDASTNANAATDMSQSFTAVEDQDHDIVTIADVTLAHGATTDVPIQLVNSTGVGGATVTLTFDPLIVNTTNVVAGDFDSIFSPDYSDVSTGTLRITCTKLGADLIGDLTIATVTLNAVGTSGSCALGLSAELTEAGGAAVPSSVDNSIFTISGTVFGSVTISPTSSDLIIGNTQPFTATCYDTSSNTLPGCTLTWACDSPAVGTIGSSSGLFTAGGVGIATVTVSATYGGVTKTDTAVVNVSAPVETVDLTDTNNFTEDVDAGTAADITVNGTFNNSVTGSIDMTPVADPVATVGSYEFTGADEALLGLTVTPDAAIAAELAGGNCTIRIEVCYNAAELASKNIELSTLALWRFDGTDWVQMVAGTPPCVANGTNGNCVWIEVNNLSTFALVGAADASTTGDVTGDGAVNVGDVTYLARYLAGWTGYETTVECADVTGDGEVNVGDVTYLARYLAGWTGYTL